MPRNVAIVYSPDFTEDLERLAFQAPVWLVDTPANRSAAEAVLHASVEWPHITVTLFRPPETDPSKRDWLTLIEQIGLREKAIDSFEVIGAALTLGARAAFDEAGFARIDETPRGFRARR